MPERGMVDSGATLGSDGLDPVGMVDGRFVLLNVFRPGWVNIECIRHNVFHL